MAVRDRTILDSVVDTDAINVRIDKVEEQVSTFKDGVKFVGEYPTYATMISSLPTPSDSDWVFITVDENHSNAKTQYVYNVDKATWIYGGGTSNINNASSTVFGAIKLSGDLEGSAASSPQLKSIITGGTYAFGNNVATVNTKGLISNIVSSVASYEWIYYSNSSQNQRGVATNTLTVPSYDVTNASLLFIYNGLIIPEPNNIIRTNSTTLNTTFTINTDDDIMIMNLKFIGRVDTSAFINDLSADVNTMYSSNKLESDFAKLTDNIIPKTTDIYNLGSPTYKYDNIYLVNAPTVLSDPKHKRNVEGLQINALEFVNTLQSYQYQLLDSGKRTHTGLLTTQLKDTMNYFNVDYAMYVKDIDSGEEAIRYEELISVLIQAISQNTPWYKKLYYKIKKYFRGKVAVNND